MEITNLKIEYYPNIKKINLFENNELIEEIISAGNDRFGKPLFQINLNEWCSFSQQKRDKTISVFLKLKNDETNENKIYKSIIPFNSKVESFIFNNFNEMKKVGDKWVII